MILVGWSFGALAVSALLCHFEKLCLMPPAVILLDPRSAGPLSQVSRSLGCFFTSTELPGFRSTVLAVDFLAPRAGARNTEESKGIRFMAPDSIMAKQRSLLYAGLEQLLLPESTH
ncbi:car [Symbiodinium sp. CCMP2456]|nr:car [Symbiodinium sp. CCMP2456]